MATNKIATNDDINNNASELKANIYLNMQKTPEVVILWLSMNFLSITMLKYVVSRLKCKLCPHTICLFYGLNLFGQNLTSLLSVSLENNYFTSNCETMDRG